MQEPVRPTRVFVRPVPLDKEGKARNGVYHGRGERLWVADPDHGFSRFLRAATPNTATRKASVLFPGSEVKYEDDPQ